MQGEEERPLRAEAPAESSGHVEQTLLGSTTGKRSRCPEQPPPRPPPQLSVTAVAAAEASRRRVWDDRGRTTLVINLASIMERVDEQLLPALYSRVGASFAADPEQLGVLTFARAVVQELASPLAGVLGHYVNRVYVITAGAALWGAMCLCFAFTRSLGQVGWEGGGGYGDPGCKSDAVLLQTGELLALHAGHPALGHQRHRARHVADASAWRCCAVLPPCPLPTKLQCTGSSTAAAMPLPQPAAWRSWFQQPCL